MTTGSNIDRSNSVNVNKLKIKTEYRSLVPRPSKDDYDLLFESIKTEGFWKSNPIKVNNDMVIIDGYTRYDIAHELNINEIPITILEFDNKNSERKYVINSNLKRRHLKPAQKVEICRSLIKIESKKSKQRQGTRTDLNIPPSIGGMSNCGETLKIVAKKVNINHETLRRGLKIMDKMNDDPEIKKDWDMAIQGKENISKIYRKIERKEKEKNLVAPEIPDGQYNVIMADPPWKYDFSRSSSREIENQYPTMELDEICKLKIPSADDSVLFLWCPQVKIPEGMQVMKAWNFNYKTGMAWVKDKIGQGYYFRGQHELVLVGTKGSPELPGPTRRPSSVFNAPRTKHSVKPDIIYKIIEKMYPGHNYLELFARNKRKGWTSWGNEI